MYVNYNHSNNSQLLPQPLLIILGVCFSGCKFGGYDIVLEKQEFLSCPHEARVGSTSPLCEVIRPSTLSVFFSALQGFSKVLYTSLVQEVGRGLTWGGGGYAPFLQGHDPEVSSAHTQMATPHCKGGGPLLPSLCSLVTNYTFYCWPRRGGR